MPSKTLTEKVVEEIQHPAKGQVHYWDTVHRGFGLRVGTRRVTFILQYPVKKGKTERVTLGVYPAMSFAAAVKLMLDYKAMMDDGRSVALHIEEKRAANKRADEERRTRKKRTLRYAMERKCDPKAGLSTKTREAYIWQCERYLGDWMDRELHTIRGADVVARYDAIVEATNRAKAAGAEEPGKAMAGCVMRTFQALWNRVGDDDDFKEALPACPTRRLNQDRKGWRSGEVRDWSVQPSGLQAFYEAAATHQRDNPVASHRSEGKLLGDAVLMLMFTGLRKSNVQALRWDQVDREAGVIRFNKADTKMGRALEIPITDLVAEILDRRACGGAYVFPALRGGKNGSRREGRHLRDINPVVRAVAARAGLSTSAHGLRRTYANVCTLAGIQDVDRKRLMGHAVDGVTERHYTVAEVVREHVCREAQKVADEFKRRCGIEPSAPNVVPIAAKRA